MQELDPRHHETDGAYRWQGSLEEPVKFKVGGLDGKNVELAVLRLELKIAALGRSCGRSSGASGPSRSSGRDPKQREETGPGQYACGRGGRDAGGVLRQADSQRAGQ
jgi:hypothetical protein